jgi:hypothetical protein
MQMIVSKSRIAYLTALTLFGLSMPVLADDPHWPLRIRGSADLQSEYNNGNLVVSFQAGTGPADSGLQPGQASWLDRGFRPTEPHQLQQTISEEEAAQLVTYLSTPDNYVTFYTAPGGDGYFGVFSSEPYTQGQPTPSEPRRFTWNASVNAGRAGQGGTVVIDSGNPGVIGGGPRVFEHGHWVPKNEGHGVAATQHHLEKEHHHGETKARETGAKQHVASQKMEHAVRTGGGHQVSLVKAVHQPLVRTTTPKVNNHPVNNGPKKKK